MNFIIIDNSNLTSREPGLKISCCYNKLFQIVSLAKAYPAATALYALFAVWSAYYWCIKIEENLQNPKMQALFARVQIDKLYYRIKDLFFPWQDLVYYSEFVSNNRFDFFLILKFYFNYQV